MSVPHVKPEHKTKLIIVGSGPSGLTAAIYAGRANLAPVVAVGGITANAIPGGQLMITTEVENFPGFPEGIQGPELMERFMAQAKKHGAIFVEEFATEFILKEGGPHQVKIGDDWYESQAIILANGATARWLNAPGELELRNKGISACATCDGPLPVFRNKHIFVIGGGDSACEEALFLTRFASQVTLIHRRDKLRASKVMIDRALSNPKIDVLWNTTIIGYKGEGFIQAIITKDLVTGEEKEVQAGGVFMAIGHVPATNGLENTGLDLDEAGYIKVKELIKTNIDGVFTAGDVHDTMYRQAISAAGFGCMSAIAAERWLEAKQAEEH
eukprot:TRINITY_DN2181_c0_g1_i1.p1 TRINITY_DN2181_c0_g1~~TRINITY_DN2181_c0_g1_i1.p1  ORF type:complete len:385 (-),score=199.26 TRINITY_DN2181_c0_g1_i1:108-1091(-)